MNVPNETGAALFSDQEETSRHLHNKLGKVQREFSLLHKRKSINNVPFSLVRAVQYLMRIESILFNTYSKMLGNG